MNDRATDVADRQSHQLNSLRSGWRQAWDLTWYAIAPEVLGPRIIRDAYGVAEVAALRLRSYDQDALTEEGLPQSFVERYNRHIAGRYEGAGG